MKNNIYFIADTHFNHTNVIEYSNRPFSDVNEMNELLIEKWNSIVSDTDTVYHLGDVGLGRQEDLPVLTNRLNGKKILLRGNHDRSSTSKWQECGFTVISGKTLVYGDKYILSHKPLLDHNIPDGLINIHGHIHNRDLEKEFRPDLHVCVSVERINYTPVRLEDMFEAKAKLSTRRTKLKCNYCSKILTPYLKVYHSCPCGKVSMDTQKEGLYCRIIGDFEDYTLI